MFVLDGSGSVGAENFTIIKQFVIAVVDFLPVEEQAMAGVVSDSGEGIEEESK